MTDRKLWNRADVRAEMNRMVKEATDACKKLHDIAGRIAALGVETNFMDDAHSALTALRKRSELPKITADGKPQASADGETSVKITAGGKPVTSVGEVLKPVKCLMCHGDGVVGLNIKKMLCTACSGKGVLEPKSWPQALSDASREVWRDRGCQCSLAFVFTETLPHSHAVLCPARGALNTGEY